jgi:hypothetical protein
MYNNTITDWSNLVGTATYKMLLKERQGGHKDEEQEKVAATK